MKVMKAMRLFMVAGFALCIFIVGQPWRRRVSYLVAGWNGHSHARVAGITRARSEDVRA